MPRLSTLAIRLGRNERRAIERLAQAERLPSSTLARKLLLDEAERRGFLGGVQADGLLDADTPAGLAAAMNGDMPNQGRNLLNLESPKGTVDAIPGVDSPTADPRIDF